MIYPADHTTRHMSRRKILSKAYKWISLLSNFTVNSKLYLSTFIPVNCMWKVHVHEQILDMTVVPFQNQSIESPDFSWHSKRKPRNHVMIIYGYPNTRPFYKDGFLCRFVDMLCMARKKYIIVWYRTDHRRCVYDNQTVKGRRQRGKSLFFHHS